MNHFSFERSSTSTSLGNDCTDDIDLLPVAAPEFVKRLSGEEAVDEGADLTLQFKVVGIPPPTLRWFKDDEEVSDHPRLSVDKKEDGSHLLTLHAVNKGDEAAYRCRAENSEGSSSCCFFLSVKAKPKSPKRDGKLSPNKRTVSYPTMFSTIVEKVEEEEKAGRETAQAPESPLSHFYDSLSLKSRSTWPSFLGDWAFVSGTHKARGGSVQTPEARPEVTAAAEVKPTSENVRMLRAGSPMTFSLTHQKKQGKTLNLRPRALCFVSKPEESNLSDSELYRKMLIAHRKKLRHVDFKSDAQTKPDSTPPSISHKPEQKLLQERKAGSTPTVTKGTTQSKTTFAGSSTGEHSRLKGLASTLAPLYVTKTSNDSATRMELVKAADPSKKTDRCDVLGVNSLPTAPHELGENKMETSKGGNGGLAPPLPEREEREPTPIPPEMLVIPQKTSSSHVTPSCQWTEDAFLCGSALQAPSEAKDRKTSKVDLDVAASVWCRTWLLIWRLKTRSATTAAKTT
ncbi:hypothetical protein C0Q70_07448 [Pomacea canaliculata]|uniref:Ig-like domain-containing protein n=1 Tax=Pomacea canaliculata TaxID=400727 RepID=A0A2T7PF20_POMCA|nr:hypothetical protein C0Q70_07448 [Pomacea canaliculata]